MRPKFAEPLDEVFNHFSVQPLLFLNDLYDNIFHNHIRAALRVIRTYLFHDFADFIGARGEI